jgi:hypothetical protein
VQIKTLMLSLIACAGIAQAGMIYTLTGTLSSNAPDTDLLTPNAPFSAVFTIAEPTAPYNWSSNQSNLNVGLTYQLSGSPLTTFLPGVTLWTSGAGGGYSLIFLDSNGNRIGLHMSGPQMFTGSTDAPVLVPVTFTATSGTWAYYNPDGSIITSGPFTNAQFSSVPEPSSLSLFAAAIVAGVAFRRRQRSSVC